MPFNKPNDLVTMIVQGVQVMLDSVLCGCRGIQLQYRDGFQAWRDKGSCGLFICNNISRITMTLVF